MRTTKRLDGILTNWLDADEYKVFLTVTLKKSLVDPKTKWGLPLKEEHIIRTGKFLRNSITEWLTGRHGRLNFLTFYEVGSFDQRPHLHILFDNPNGVPFGRIKGFVQSIILDRKNPWLREQWDVRQIPDQLGLLKYTLKNGNRAFIPEASCLTDRSHR